MIDKNLKNNYNKSHCWKEASGYHRILIHQNIAQRLLKNFAPGDIWIITPTDSLQDLWLNGNSVQYISINQDKFWNSDWKGKKCLSWGKKMINLLLAELWRCNPQIELGLLVWNGSFLFSRLWFCVWQRDLHCERRAAH